ncbi:MAG: hypothetical protein WAM27_09110 [Nitrososphaeraceae archaeon]
MQNKTKKKRVLIVDDDPDILITYKKGLEDNGLFEVETFAQLVRKINAELEQ